MITSAMWLTEEHAMRGFRSVWQRQMELVMIILHRESISNGYAIKLVRGFNIIVMCSVP